jgi:hypothetical protein
MHALVDRPAPGCRWSGNDAFKNRAEMQSAGEFRTGFPMRPNASSRVGRALVPYAVGKDRLEAVLAGKAVKGRATLRSHQRELAKWGRSRTLDNHHRARLSPSIA